MADGDKLLVQTVPFTVRVSEDMRKRVAIFAINNRVNQGEVVTRALELFFDNEERKVKEWKQ